MKILIKFGIHFSFFFSKNKKLRNFVETTQTSISIENLPENTSYQICFECRYDGAVNTISELKCINKTTKPLSSMKVPQVLI